MGTARNDMALKKAHVALMNDALRNISLALEIKAVFVVFALTGQATLWLADKGARLIIVFNGMRLLKYV